MEAAEVLLESYRGPSGWVIGALRFYLDVRSQATNQLAGVTAIALDAGISCDRAAMGRIGPSGSCSYCEISVVDKRILHMRPKAAPLPFPGEANRKSSYRSCL